MTVVVSSLDLFCAVIALLAIGKGFWASGKLQVVHKMIGQAFSTHCDDSSFVPAGSRSLNIYILKDDHNIYEADAYGQIYKDPSVPTWIINSTWSVQSNVTLTINIMNVKKSDQGILSCRIDTDNQGTKERVIAYLFVHDKKFDHLCPTHWELYPPRHTCIHLVDVKKEWLEASRHCYGLNKAHLVVIHDEAFDRFLSNYIRSLPEGVWIGLSNRETRDKFIWTTGKQAVYTNWRPFSLQSPTDVVCVVKIVRDGQWLDSRCDFTSPFVCEKKAAVYTSVDIKTYEVLIAYTVIIILMIILFMAVMVRPQYFKSRASPEDDVADDGMPTGAAHARMSTRSAASARSGASGGQKGSTAGSSDKQEQDGREEYAAEDDGEDGKNRRLTIVTYD
ncbi:hypothetical protein EGW08_008129 [Elysia chlorotica]|uniref:C-type lectin domain-containing protein n=1 Tax=Elysia chlorotica TaxID=188477 RepID=A0A433TRD5_ELYCH|nr:hypothetical protein EGW08_008129 [Elysia chlorotica]